MKTLLSVVLFLCLFASQAWAQTRSLTINVFGHGTVTRSPLPDSATGLYVNGTQVTIVAHPEPQWKFHKFTSGATTVTNDTVAFTMNKNRTVNAYFVKGNLLFISDESQAIASLSATVAKIFTQFETVRTGGEKIVLNDSTTITAEYNSLSGGEITQIANGILDLLNQIDAKSDTIRAIIEAQQ